MNDKEWSDWLSLVAFSVHLGTSKCSSTTEVQINLVMFSGLACFCFFSRSLWLLLSDVLSAV